MWLARDFLRTAGRPIDIPPCHHDTTDCPPIKTEENEMSRELQYFALPTEPCADVARDVPHMAHVHTVDGVKFVCAGLLPHSVPLNAEPAQP